MCECFSSTNVGPNQNLSETFLRRTFIMLVLHVFKDVSSQSYHKVSFNCDLSSLEDNRLKCFNRSEGWSLGSSITGGFRNWRWWKPLLRCHKRRVFSKREEEKQLVSFSLSKLLWPPVRFTKLHSIKCYRRWKSHAKVLEMQQISLSLPTFTFLMEYSIAWECQCERECNYQLHYKTSKVGVSFSETFGDVYHFVKPQWKLE